MAKIIPFRTREEWEKEKREKAKNEWEEWLAFEEAYAEYLNIEEKEKNKSFLFLFNKK